MGNYLCQMFKSIWFDIEKKNVGVGIAAAMFPLIPEYEVSPCFFFVFFNRLDFFLLGFHSQLET